MIVHKPLPNVHRAAVSARVAENSGIGDRHCAAAVENAAAIDGRVPLIVELVTFTVPI